MHFRLVKEELVIRGPDSQVANTRNRNYEEFQMGELETAGQSQEERADTIDMSLFRRIRLTVMPPPFPPDLLCPLYESWECVEAGLELTMPPPSPLYPLCPVYESWERVEAMLEPTMPPPRRPAPYFPRSKRGRRKKTSLSDGRYCPIRVVRPNRPDIAHSSMISTPEAIRFNDVLNNTSSNWDDTLGQMTGTQMV
jgi:hypothetical protein